MTWITRTALILATAVAGAIAIVGIPAPAQALQSISHGAGFTSPDDGMTWLGSYRLDDGSTGLCVQIELPEPDGDSFEYVDGATMFADDDRARLAVIAREWAGSENAEVAAAAQIATWDVTGWESKSPAHVARVAGDRAGSVLAIADRMRQTIAEQGSRSVRARLGVTPPAVTAGVATARVRADLDVDYLTTGWTTLPAGAHQGVLTLTGAEFEGGGSSRTVTSGTDYVVVLPSDSAHLSMSASARFDALPYGNEIVIASNPRVQSLLVTRRASASADASASFDGTSPLPFQPTVATTTSTQLATPGTAVSDTLQLSVAADSPLQTWGTYEDAGARRPVPVVVRSRLLGPFEQPIALAPAAPSGAPEVCSVSLLAERGPGRYRTPACTIDAPGYYVWMESIAPADTPAEHGSASIRPWQSAFGIATEITRIAPQPPQSPRPSALAETGARDQQAVGMTGPIAGLTALLTGAGALVARRIRASRSARS